MGDKKGSAALWVSGGLIGLLLAAALLAPVLAPNDPNETSLVNALQGPGAAYPFGTDALGRCMLSRILYGARTSIFTSLIIMAIVFCFGCIVGIAAGYMGGLADQILSKVITMTQAFPKLILAIAVAGILGMGIRNTIIALCVVEWADYARLSRNLCKSLKQRAFVKAARLCGASHWQMMWRHMLPNMLPTLVIQASLGISAMILEVASLSYLGVGISPPTAEWGAMMNSGREYMQTEIQLILIPGAAIFITAVLFNLFGEKLRDRLARS